MNIPKAYLGDSVYAECDEYRRLVLTTDNGFPDDPHNCIILEPEVIAALLRYIGRMKEKGQ